MKLVKTTDETIWITGNKPFKMFLLGDMDNSLSLYGDFGVEEDLRRMITDNELVIFCKNGKDCTALSKFLKDYGFMTIIESFSEEGESETLFSLEDFTDKSDMAFYSFFDSPSYFTIYLEDSKVKSFRELLKVLSNHGYKTPYSLISEDEELITILK